MVQSSIQLVIYLWLRESMLGYAQVKLYDYFNHNLGTLIIIIQILMQFSQIIHQASLCKFAPNSSYFAFYDSKKIYIKESSVNLNNFSILTVNSPATDVIISPDSQLLAVLLKERPIVLIYDVKGTLIAKIEDGQSGISGIIWSPDSIQLIVFSELLMKCSIYNLIDKSISYIKSPKLSTAKGCVFSSDGKLMALLEKHQCKDTISIYFCGDWKLVNSFTLDSFDVVQIIWNFNDSHIVAWENPINYRFHVLCPFKGVILRYQAYDFALGIRSVQFSNKSYFLGVGSFDEKIRIFNAMTWKLIAELDCSSPIITSGQTKIYKQDDSLKAFNRMKLVDKAQYRIPIVKPVSNDKSLPNQGVNLLEFSYDDSYIACKNENMPYTIWIWNVSTLQVQAILSLSCYVKMFKWSTEENTLCIASGNQRILMWKDGTIMECSFPITGMKFNVQRFLWSKDSKRMLLFDKSQVIYADLMNND